MQIIFRTLAILAAALVIVGGLYAFSQSSVGQSFASAGAGAHVEGGSPPSTVTSNSTDGTATAAPSSTSHGGEGQGGSLMGLVTVGKTLGITAAITALIALGERLLAWGRRNRPRAASPTPL